MDPAKAGNRVAVGAVGPPIRIEPLQMRQRALALEAGPGLPAHRWLDRLRPHGDAGRRRPRPRDGLNL
jgi:hypothetical protein